MSDLKDTKEHIEINYNYKKRTKYYIFILIISVVLIYLVFNNYKNIEKNICLNNLINDINNKKLFSYYRIKDFRCGYNISSDDVYFIKEIIINELKNGNKYKYVHEFTKSKIFYTNKLDLGLKYLKE